MALLKIARMGHPVLRVPAEPIADPTAPAVGRLVADMLETMVDAGGVGLAATQVHVPRRLVIFSVPPSRADDPDAPEGSPRGPQPVTVLINPEIIVLDETTEEAWEGCLSVPGMLGRVPRWRRIGVRGWTPTGALHEREAVGFHARVVQHECDHLDGFLYPMRVRDLHAFGFAEEMRRYPLDPPERDALAEEEALDADELEARR